MATRNFKRVLFFILMPLLSLIIIASTSCTKRDAFNGNRAYRDILTQVNFGARTPGSVAHDQVIVWIQTQLQKSGWKVEIQKGFIHGQSIHNLIASRSDEKPNIILGAHYDSRLISDQDTGSMDEPVPGANDGASGVAILVELARSLPENTLPLWLVFFDAEDNGGIPGWDWILGSVYFVSTLDSPPDSVVIIDMVGDEDLNIYQEGNSDPTISNSIWSMAEKHGYSEEFIPEVKYSMLDDHTPFLASGIPTALIIDFDYPYWHTINDTPDKVSPSSLDTVGSTLWHWIIAQE